MVGAMVVLLLSCVARAADISTGAIDAAWEDDALTFLAATSGPAWLSGAEPLYDLGGASLDAALELSAEPDGQLRIRLVLTNPASTPVQADVRFPTIGGLGTGDGEPLGYFLPALGPILDDEVTTHRRYYGGLLPLQFMEIHQGDAGLWLMTRDLQARDKTFSVGKDEDGFGRFEVEWPHLVVPAKGSTTLDATLGVHDSDWHAALDAYRRWVRTWYQPRAAPKDAFRQAFNLRQLHLHDNEVLGAHPGAFDPETGRFRIQEYLAEDIEQLGGVDWVHIFDWGMDEVHGRVGDYNPWSWLGDPAGLQAEVDALQEAGIGVGLYTDGYLLDTPSLVGQRWGESWELQDSHGEEYTTYAPSWHVCPAVAEWQEHFALRNGRRTELRVGASGLYVDQFGYGYQYPCYRGDHDHSVPSGQLEAERAFVEGLRRSMSPDQVLYTEAGPGDVASQWQDGSFTEAVRSFRDDPRTVPVAIRRFALPLHKTFELLTQDAPLGDDVEGVRLAFFNGEGTRHMGYFEDDAWFSEEALAEIRHAWSVLHTWRAVFAGEDPIPLVDTSVDGVYANLFQDDGHRLWTLYNASGGDVSGEVMRVDSVPEATWEDCWNDAPLAVEEDGGEVVIALDLAAGGVGCVVETRPVPAATLVAHWALDEAGGGTVEDAVGGADGVVWGGGATLGVDGAADRLGTALELDGTSAILLGEVDALSGLTEDLSLAAWIRPDRDDDVMRILAVDGWDDGGLVFGLTRAEGRRALFLTTVGVQDYVLPVVIPTGRWSHVAVVLDSGGSAWFSVDGELRGVVPGDAGGTTTESRWWLGANGTDGHWVGALDDVRVYRGALTRAELRALADITPPLVGEVRAPEEPWADRGQLSLWWPGFYDPGSGIAGYEVALGTSEGSRDLLDWTAVGAEQQGELDGLALPDGTVHVSVRATDGMGQRSEARGTVRVDTTAPALLAEWRFDDGVVPAPVAMDPALERTEDFTVTAWIRPVEEGFQAILGSDEGGWFFGLGGDGDDLVFVTMGVEEYVLAADLPRSTWTHVAVAFDRYSDATFSIDGELAGVVHGTIPAADSSSGFEVGGTAWPWRGGLDEVRLYDGVLDPDEIAAI
ncbi:MAG: LamG domain-containing protein, partial [Deltaproteobacteria bacterium]